MKLGLGAEIEGKIKGSLLVVAGELAAKIKGSIEKTIGEELTASETREQKVTIDGNKIQKAKRYLDRHLQDWNCSSHCGWPDRFSSVRVSRRHEISYQEEVRPPCNHRGKNKNRQRANEPAGGFSSRYCKGQGFFISCTLCKTSGCGRSPDPATTRVAK